MEQIQHFSLGNLLSALLRTVEERGIGLVDVIQHGDPTSLHVGFTVHGPGECMLCHFIRVVDIEVESPFRKHMATEESRTRFAHELELGRLPESASA